MNRLLGVHLTSLADGLPRLLGSRKPPVSDPSGGGSEGCAPWPGFPGEFDLNPKSYH